MLFSPGRLFLPSKRAEVDSNALLLAAAAAGTLSSLISLGFLFRAHQRTREWEEILEAAHSHQQIQEAAAAVLETLAGALGAQAAFVYEEREETPVLLSSWASAPQWDPEELSQAASRVLHGYHHSDAIRLPQIGPRALALVWIGAERSDAVNLATRLVRPAVGLFVALRASGDEVASGTEADTRKDFVSLGKLAGGVAHELNTPLATILTNVSRVARGAEDPKLIRRMDIISKAVDRCRTVVEKLQLYARRPYDMEDENLSFSRLVWVPVDVNQLICDTVELHRAKLKESEEQVETDLTDMETTVMADPNALSAAMRDLLKAALEASGSLSVSTRDEQDAVVVTFESKTDDKAPLSRDLEAAHVIAKRHKGHLKIRDSVGDGPLVLLHLPKGENQP